MGIEKRTRSLGSVFGHWRIESLIGTGSGGRSAVFGICHKEAASVKRALKVVSLVEERGRPETQSEAMRSQYESHREACRSRAEQEVLLMDNLKGNTNIVDYEDHCFIDWDDGESYGRDMLIRMELLSDLREKLRMGYSFGRGEIIKLGMDICTALELCHKKDILHRDIKPENIFVNRDGSWKLGDFGISRILDATVGLAATGVGTPQYWAPEQAAGSYDQRVDIYSLGLVLYELCNDGRLPFAETRYVSPEAMGKRMAGTPLPAPSAADPILASVILKACAYRAAERYSSAAQFRAALEEAGRADICTPPAGMDPYATVYADTDAPTPAPTPSVDRTDRSNSTTPIYSSGSGAQPGGRKKPDKKKVRMIAVVLVLFCMLLPLFSLTGKDKDEGKDPGESEATTPPVHTVALPGADAAESTPVPTPTAAPTPTPEPTPIPAQIAGEVDYGPVIGDGSREMVVDEASSIFHTVQQNWRSYGSVNNGEQFVYVDNGEIVWLIDKGEPYTEYYFVNGDARFILRKAYATADDSCSLYTYKGKLIELITADKRVLGPLSGDEDFYEMEPLAASGQDAYDFAWNMVNTADPALLVGSGTPGLGNTLSIRAADASSTLSEYRVTHHPDRIIDGSLSTAWVEGVDGNGEGEYVTLYLGAKTAVSGMYISSGYQADNSRFTNNSRPKELSLSFSDGSSLSFMLSDVMGAQNLIFPATVETEYVRLTIVSVYPGSACTDTCISEVALW